MKPLHIFKPGSHVAKSGVAYDFSDADLTAIAAAYDPARHEAPLVVGHPRHDDPAYGWVKSLSFSDGVLQAEPDQVEPQFAELVEAGRFKKISASLYPPYHPSNPAPDNWYLRHVGFLGAMPPAVKGLPSASFNEAEEGAVEFGDWAEVQNASLWRALRDWMISKFGIEEANQVVPDYAATVLTEEAARPAPILQDTSSNYSESTTAGDEMSAEDKVRLAALEKENADLKTSQANFAERERVIAEREATARRAEITEFVEGLATAGKILPKDKPGLIAFMAGANEAGVIEFGEGDNKESKAANEWLRGFLSGLPKQVEFGEIGNKGAVINDGSTGEEIARLAVEFQESERKAGREISASGAVKHVTKANA